MQSVTVLTPNGRRHGVKVQANTTLLAILEETCKKFNFDPEMYDLKTQHNKLLDLSLMFRFAGLPNNSNLEMVECVKKRCESMITICIQMEDGSRVNSSFTSSTTLQDIISKLCPDKGNSDQNPIVVYMRKEVHGESLATTTLKDLGLSSGSALLRLVNADPESLKTQANVSAPLPQKPKMSEEERKSKISTKIASSSSSEVPIIENVETPVATQVEAMEIDDAIEKAPLASNSNVEEVKINQGTTNESNVNNIKEEILVNVTNDASEVITIEEIKPTEAVIVKLDDRGTIIFSLDSFDNSSKTEVPDSFFDLTETDVRHLYRELKSQVDNYESSPLLTKQLRQLEDSKKILNQLSLYKMCSLRIRFPNRLVIQTRFSTITKIEVVKEFVRTFLVDPLMQFDLYVTPPKTILEADMNLLEAQLVPSALIHFGCEPIETEYIKAEYFDKLSSGFAALSILNIAEEEDDISSKDKSEAGPSGSQNQSGSLTSKKPIPSNFLQSSASSEANGKLPKWFKKTGY
ncbi:unnamed protein product [Diamesa serratosioi]